MVKIKVNVKTKNDSIPSDTTKRKMPVITNPKIRRTPRRDDTNVGDIRVKVKFQKDTVKASPTLENPDVIIEPRHNEHQLEILSLEKRMILYEMIQLLLR